MKIYTNLERNWEVEKEPQLVNRDVFFYQIPDPKFSRFMKPFYYKT